MRCPKSSLLFAIAAAGLCAAQPESPDDGEPNEPAIEAPRLPGVDDTGLPASAEELLERRCRAILQEKPDTAEGRLAQAILERRAARDAHRPLLDELLVIPYNFPGTDEARAAQAVIDELEAEFSRKEQAEDDAFEEFAFRALQEAGVDRERLRRLEETLRSRFISEFGGVENDRAAYLANRVKDTLTVRESKIRLLELDRASRERRAASQLERTMARLEGILQSTDGRRPESAVSTQELAQTFRRERERQRRRAAERDDAASRALAAALRAPLQYDRRWRRLSELVLDYPDTSAAGEARRRLEEHSAALGPARIRNASSRSLVLEYKGAYTRWQPYVIPPGGVADFPVALHVRVKADTPHGRISGVVRGGSSVVYDGESPQFVARAAP